MTHNICIAKDIISEYDLFIVDVWGVIRQGSSVYTKAVESLNWISKQKPLYFLSNSPRLSSGLAEKLIDWGVNTSVANVYTSGQVAISMILNNDPILGVKNHSVYHLTDNDFENIYEGTNVNFTDDLSKANILIVSAQIQANEDANKYNGILEEAASMGMICICPNPDTIIPADNGFNYGPGYIVKNYKGKVIYTGKPQAIIYQELLKKYSHIPKERMLMIGDTLDMDILGAHNVGISSALVSTGNAQILMQKLGLKEDDFGSIINHLELKPSILLSLEK
ncbi:MAG: hypothetical protein RLZZ59_903 [Pseudomonadota bacterium]|jgi:HAD superfamily hydrolase (TIGR01459 family)